MLFVALLRLAFVAIVGCMDPGAGPSSQEEWLILSGEGCKTKIYSDLEDAARQVVFRCDYMSCSQQKIFGFLGDTAKQLFRNEVENMLNSDGESYRAQNEHEHEHEHTWENFDWDDGPSRGFGLVLRCCVKAHSRASMAPSTSTGVGEPLYAITIGQNTLLGLAFDDLLAHALSVLDTNQIAEIECPKNDAGAVSEAFSNKRLWRFELRGDSALHIMSSGPSYKILVTGGSYKPLESWQDLLEAIDESVQEHGLAIKLHVICLRGDNARVTAYFINNGWHVRPIINKQKTQALTLSIPNPHEDQQLVKRRDPDYNCKAENGEPPLRTSKMPEVLVWTLKLYEFDVMEGNVDCHKGNANTLAERIQDQGLWNTKEVNDYEIHLKRQQKLPHYLVSSGTKMLHQGSCYDDVVDFLEGRIHEAVGLLHLYVFCPPGQQETLRSAIQKAVEQSRLKITIEVMGAASRSRHDHEAGTSQSIEQDEPIDKDWLRLGPP
ncbi:hypothetical protein FA10DRAFT_284039 [Acaromyces ingoldii]|uniref:Uncharacterized protein n=1 Tax=Acaromyces ingoldii TaxID=215250 RepID=A0A316YPD4_9BASI|nr:hypothetical protein FA10DRAFT_284039 [Acaromyces ingoldii]PWN91091.1 hypothetical protein FA10DRAFT_284039 [Acaromyces ingoldii]